MTTGHVPPKHAVTLTEIRNCTPRICELARYNCKDVVVKEAWSGPAELELFRHVRVPVADLPVLEVVSAVHILTDLTLDLGEVVHDYLA